MSVQRDEKKMWAALDQFFLRVLGEKTGRAVMQESREQAADFLAAAQEPSPSRLDGGLYRAEAPGTGRGKADGKIYPGSTGACHA